MVHNLQGADRSAKSCNQTRWSGDRDSWASEGGDKLESEVLLHKPRVN